MSLVHTKLNRILNHYQDTQNLSITFSERNRAYFRYAYAEEVLIETEDVKSLVFDGSQTNIREVLGGIVFEVNNKKYFFNGIYLPRTIYMVSAWMETPYPNGDTNMYVITQERGERKLISCIGEIHEIG